MKRSLVKSEPWPLCRKKKLRNCTEIFNGRFVLETTRHESGRRDDCKWFDVAKWHDTAQKRTRDTQQTTPYTRRHAVGPRHRRLYDGKTTDDFNRVVDLLCDRLLRFDHAVRIAGNARSPAVHFGLNHGAGSVWEICFVCSRFFRKRLEIDRTSPGRADTGRLLLRAGRRWRRPNGLEIEKYSW